MKKNMHVYTCLDCGNTGLVDRDGQRCSECNGAINCIREASEDDIKLYYKERNSKLQTLTVTVGLDTSEFDKSIKRINSTMDITTSKFNQFKADIEYINKMCQLTDESMSDMIKKIREVAEQMAVKS